MAISTEDWDRIPHRVEQLGLGMIFLSDSEQRVISDYGLSDATLGTEVARPASFLIDQQGDIVWRHLPDDWRVRLGPEEYLGALERLQDDEEGGS